MSAAIRVLICDDHALFRTGLRQVLESAEGIEVVGEAADGVEVVDLALEHLPDVVVMDVRMPRRDGIAATRALGGLLPATRILMLTMSDDAEDLFEAVKAGASGYLLKEISIDEVGAAVHAVVAGHSIISPSMASKLLAEFSALAHQVEGRSPASNGPHLTDREMQVLCELATGRSNREIAAELCISENTVKNHVRNLLEKLQLHSRMEAAMYAVRENLVELG